MSPERIAIAVGDRAFFIFELCLSICVARATCRCPKPSSFDCLMTGTLPYLGCATSVYCDVAVITVMEEPGEASLPHRCLAVGEREESPKTSDHGNRP